MNPKHILTGKRFGRLVVGDEHHQHKTAAGSRATVWRCACDCGAVVDVRAGNLRSGNTTSCGCLRTEMLVDRATTHGSIKTAEYRSWFSAKQRCTNPKTQFFHAYGGRGIQICERWSNSFEAFFADMGPKPSLQHSLDRIDPDGNYEPSNCRWAAPSDQASNKRNSKLLTFRGETKSVAQWAEELGVPKPTVYSRLTKGWTAEEALLGRSVRPCVPIDCAVPSLCND